VNDAHLSIALLTLGDPARMTGGYLYHRRIADLAPRFNARVAFVSFPERPFPLAALDAPAVLRRATASGAEALVLDSIVAAYLAPSLLVARPRSPLVGMLHQPPGGIDFGRLRMAVQARLDRLAWSRAPLLMVASRALMEDLAATGMPRARMRVVPPGRDVAPAAGRSAGDLRQGRKAAFLCVGNWLERKGILSLLEAFAALPPETATLHLAGDDAADLHYAARVRARLARPDLIDRVVVHGSLSLERVAALYQAADAFVLPSRKEPYGTVYGEAMAYGLPVVGWRAGNLPHLARDGIEGLVIEPDDLDGLSRALRTLAEDDALRLRLGAAARQRAQSFPTWEQSAELFFASVREAIRLERESGSR
jgi:glycosyltransferase involved in cell wall biosynthesis